MGIKEVLEKLKKEGLVLEVEETLSPDVEIPILSSKLASQTPKAFLFKNVEGKEYPLVTNLYFNKFETIFQADSITLLKNFKMLSSILFDVSLDPSSKITLLARLAWVSEFYPKTIEASPFIRRSALDVDLGKLPALRHSSGEEYPVIKNPIIILFDKKLDKTLIYSEPVQVVDEKALLLHTPKKSKASLFLEEAAKHGESIDIAIIIGVSPHLQLVSNMDWIPWFNKYLLAGALSGKSVSLVRVEKNFYVPAEAEMILVGELVPGDVRPEGKMLYEDMQLYGGSPMPLVRVKSIWHKPTTVFYTSLTHPYNSDEYTLNTIREKFMLEYLQLFAPDISYLTFLSYDAYRTLILALNNPHPGRAFEVGSLVFSLTLNPNLDTIIVFSEKSKIDKIKVKELLPSLLSALRPEKILYFETIHEEDVLRQDKRGKIIVDATSLSLDYYDEEGYFLSDKHVKLREAYEKIIRELRGS